jgi:protein involved in polysaccharide export with SLBB domain
MKSTTLSIWILIFYILFQGHIFAAASDSQAAMLEQLPPDQRASILSKMQAAESLTEEVEEVFSDEAYLMEKPDWKRLNQLGVDEKRSICDDCIFGYDYFKYAPTTFSPINSSSISSDYILGPGDKLNINFYGNNSMKYEAMISREGNLFLDPLGPINLLGLTFSDAITLIKRRIETELIGTKVSISLEEVRAINIYFLGEAYQPGKYTMSGLTTVSNALIASGGVNKDGSLRNIKIRRSNETIAVYDFYDFLLKGSLRNDLKLEDGDVIFIPFIEQTVKLGGAFKRPGIYEIHESDSLQDAIFLGGGFKSNVPDNPTLEFSYLDRKTSQRKYEIINEDNLKILFSN